MSDFYMFMFQVFFKKKNVKPELVPSRLMIGNTWGATSLGWRSSHSYCASWVGGVVICFLTKSDIGKQ